MTSLHAYPTQPTKTSPRQLVYDYDGGYEHDNEYDAKRSKDVKKVRWLVDVVFGGGPNAPGLTRAAFRPPINKLVGQEGDEEARQARGLRLRLGQGRQGRF